MGYYTYFNIELEGPIDARDKCAEDIKALGEHGEELMREDCLEAKWYSWDEDMTEIAKKNPDVLIVLAGDGEGSDDMWECRYKGEKKEYHHIEMPPFTELLTEAETKYKK